MRRFLAVLSACMAFGACRPDTHVPKPRGYYNIEFPEHQYQLFNNPSYPYSFEHPVYSRIIPDTNFFGKKPENPYWINVEFPSLGGSIYISYKTVNAGQPLERLIEDAYQMTEFHTKRADNIEPFVFHNDSSHVHGIMYSVTGNAASSYQFYATDSTNHYLRGALYFDVSPNADSLLPVNDFIKEDMEHMLKTLRWK